MSPTSAKKDDPKGTGSAGQEASSAMDKAKDAARGVGQMASHAAGAVGSAAEGATSAVGSGMQNLAGKVRDYGPSGGMMGQATEGVASGLDAAGKYLREENLSGMAEDLSGLIRRNPIPAVLVGIGVGFLLARTLTSSRSY